MPVPDKQNIIPISSTSNLTILLSLKSDFCPLISFLALFPFNALTIQPSSMNEPEFRTIAIVDVEFGKNVTVVQPVNLYGCKIDDDSFVGPFVEIQKAVKIGKRCRIQSHAF